MWMLYYWEISATQLQGNAGGCQVALTAPRRIEMDAAHNLFNLMLGST